MKIVLDAGHSIVTPGKQTIQKDPIKEWILNDRVADHIEVLLKDYDVEIMRVDDWDDGMDDVALTERTNKANNWGADLYLSIHHNAFKPNVGTGVSVYRSETDKTPLGEMFVERMTKYTGLPKRGCQAKLLSDGRDYYHVIREAKMQSFLLEGGFMTHWGDLEVITSVEGAKNYARAIVDVLVEYFELTKSEKYEHLFTLPKDGTYEFTFKNGKENMQIYLKKA